MTVRQPSREVPIRAVSGWGMLALQLLAPFGFAGLIIWFVGHVKALEAAAFAARQAGRGCRDTGTTAPSGMTLRR